MDANGGHRKRLTGEGKAETGPVFSPDGKEIAFERENEIWQMRSNGTKLRRLAPEGRYPDYSPDGRWLTFSITKNGADSTVWLMRADGSHRRKLGPGQDSVFSADGKKLAYTGSGKATTDANVSIMRVDGSHAHHVTGGCCPSWG
jgi:Tol biopolymer transport system component